jgi:hypothetical protein
MVVKLTIYLVVKLKLNQILLKCKMRNFNILDGTGIEPVTPALAVDVVLVVLVDLLVVLFSALVTSPVLGAD